MNPFESARIEAENLRKELELKGVSLALYGLDLLVATCKALDVSLKHVKPDFHLLKGADATIEVKRKWILVRNDVSDEIKAFLIAHELGHLRLHPLVSGTVEVNQDALTADSSTNGAREVESYGARERQELQANVFAREFLLPRRDAYQAFIADKCGATKLAFSRKLPLELVRLQLYDAVLLPNISKSTKVFQLPEKPTQAQAPAVESDAKTSLVEAGPGTGKTTALLLRLRRLIASGVSADSIVILTFSNKAARELVERARAGNIPGADRVWIGTFHAFGLEFLRKFGNLHGLESRFPVLDKLATLAMLEDDVTSADLKAFDPLSNPSPWLENVVDTIRRAKDEVFDSAQFSASVANATSGDPDIDAKRGDVATIFARYELLLSRRKAVDLTDLLCVSIRLMQLADTSVERFLAGIHHVMVDEYQDVNRASALLVKELAKASKTLWVVGDANQAIYAFMGASSTNLDKFQTDFPGAVSIPLSVNHRSSQEIVNAFGVVASRNPAGRPTICLNAERGNIGYGPCAIHSASENEQLNKLACRVRQLEANGTKLAEQAVIVYKNSDAAELAAGLEQRGVPVLYLGNIFERPEIKDLICLMQLAVDPYGVNLIRSWYSPVLSLSREGADAIFAQTNSQDKSWSEVDGAGLSARDAEAWRNLKRACSIISEKMSPWEALSVLLLDDGVWLRELVGRDGQEAANVLMAVWQFVHFCRSPDGTGRWPSVKNFPQRIRDRVRLGEDRSMRSVPPEAEGMNAVRILTAHGSKGLEFDAVHFLGVTKNTYETPKVQLNKYLPDDVIDSSKALDLLKNERHNLLYVVVSRPRFHLSIYSVGDDELPSALNGLLTPINVDSELAQDIADFVSQGNPEPTKVSLEEYLQFVKCPKRHEMTSRAGRALREDLKLYRSIDVATRRTISLISADESLRSSPNWSSVVVAEMEKLGLDKHSMASVIKQRIDERVKCGMTLLAEGNMNTSTISMGIGSLNIELQPDQVFQDGPVKRLRFIRPNSSSRPSMKQPLAALLDAHNKSGSGKMVIEVATLSDGKLESVGTVRGATPAKYAEKAAGLCAKHFPAAPEDARTCHFCAYMFPCNKRGTE